MTTKHSEVLCLISNQKDFVSFLLQHFLFKLSLATCHLTPCHLQLYSGYGYGLNSQYSQYGTAPSPMQQLQMQQSHGFGMGMSQMHGRATPHKRYRSQASTTMLGGYPGHQSQLSHPTGVIRDMSQSQGPLKGRAREPSQSKTVVIRETPGIKQRVVKHDRNGTNTSTTQSGMADDILTVKLNEQRRNTADNVTVKKEHRDGHHHHHHHGNVGLGRRQKSSSAADIKRKTGNNEHDLDVEDLMSSIRFARSRSQGTGAGLPTAPTANQLQRGKYVTI